MQKIVVNRCHGGFGLSHKAVLRYADLKGITLYWEKGGILVHYGTDPNFMDKGNPGWFSVGDIPRDDPALVQVVEELGEAANGECAELKVVKIPDAISWAIEEYDGLERVAEEHRTW